MNAKRYLPHFVRRCGRTVQRRVRHALHSVLPVTLNEPLSRPIATIQPLKTVAIVEKGDLVSCPVLVRNLGDQVWSSHGRCPVNLVAKWLKPAPFSSLAWKLPMHVAPGEEVVVMASFTAPESIGDFVLEFDLVQDSRMFNCTSRMECHVNGRTTEDIDYHDFYATSNLERDFWTVVGPTTRDEFDRLSAVKLQHLIDLGLTPDSRLLDVGCGTGLVAVAAEKFLNDRGAYFGTDLKQEAIDFCKRRYTRPNFAFAANEMTRLPILNQRFDMICFYSVFTHTFPDETALLLSDAKKLLAPNGIIFADVFTSPLVDGYGGNRGAVEVNESHLLRLINLVGLDARLVMSSRWQEHAERKFFRFALQ